MVINGKCCSAIGHKRVEALSKKTKINESSRKYFSKNEETYNGTIRTRCCNVSWAKSWSGRRFVEGSKKFYNFKYSKKFIDDFKVNMTFKMFEELKIYRVRIIRP